MDESTRKRIEEQWRQLLISTETAQPESRPADERKPPVVVIRRRKVAPDYQNA